MIDEIKKFIHQQIELRSSGALSVEEDRQLEQEEAGLDFMIDKYTESTALMEQLIQKRTNELAIKIITRVLNKSIFSATRDLFVKISNEEDLLFNNNLPIDKLTLLESRPQKFLFYFLRSDLTYSKIFFSVDDVWRPGLVVEALKCAESSVFIVQSAEKEFQLIDGSQIALVDMKSLLKEGTQVLVDNDSLLMLGCVREHPQESNRWRYMIQFYNDTLKYFYFERVFALFEHKTINISDISHRIGLNVNQNIPVTYRKGDEVFVVKEREWVKAQVVDVDCSLVLVSAETEIWIHSQSILIRHASPVVPKSGLSRQKPINGIFRYLNPPLSVNKYICQPEPYVTHTCGPACQEGVRPVADLDRESLNYLMYPLVCGWGRTKMIIFDQTRVEYTSPCGRRFYTLEEIDEHLHVIESDLCIDMFTFDVDVRPTRRFEASNVKVSVKDISLGKENLPISCVNSLDESLPNYVEYVTGRIPSKRVRIDTDPGFLVCCDCTDDCRDPEKCACRRLTNESAQRDATYRHRMMTQTESVITGIYECNHMCSCSRRCRNRVGQNLMKWHLQVFYTKDKGWGLRCLEDIPSNTFVCMYNGMVLNDREATKDGTTFGDEYLADLDFADRCEIDKGLVVSDDSAIDNSSMDSFDSSGDSDVIRPSPNKKTSSKNASLSYVPIRSLFDKDNSLYILDAKIRGNVGRFTNHSCSPNLFVQSVFIDSHDLRCPYIAYFTSRTLVAGSELTWNYNYQIGSVPGRVIMCRCGSSNCKGRLL